MNREPASFILKVMLITLLSIAVLSFSLTTDAGMFKSKFKNSDGDTICVYVSHFKEVYVNVGYAGICNLTIEDE